MERFHTNLAFAINPLKFVNGIAKYALSKKLKIFEHTKVNKI